ncbi:PREDICTED: trans-1,2-dihydrobenzene-1,2-diol dehydrogenase-like [Polistes dominula]|uniref:Trans-1,2-dihydrobenzene-1,2-diol dehydrogenase n=1 Tax=Polistes dominula TaxID=743375 RepID=A0ABM1J6B1_POLDO|nr:PREDICTED: trans-1,2-dihydrobenzene-1,2-diol dehydrogenase-like [Polistes dominula]
MATRWGIAGAGKISHDFVASIMSKEVEHHVIAVAAKDLSRAQNFTKDFNIKRSYDNYLSLAEDKDIEVVYIGTLNTTHYEIAKIMLEHGKHVLCEKSLTMNAKQTKSLITLAKSKNLFLMEAVWSRFFPLYKTIQQEIQSGNIGKIHQVIIPFGFNLKNVERVNKKSLGGGTILDLGVYCLQFLCMIFNNKMPDKIKATGFVNEDGVDVSTSTTLLYNDNTTATILTHSLVNLSNEAYIYGEKGTIRVPNFWCPTELHLPGLNSQIPLPKTNYKMNFKNSEGLYYEANAVRMCLQQGKIEHPLMTHETSILLAQLEDELRKQIGVTYPEDSTFVEYDL